MIVFSQLKPSLLVYTVFLLIGEVKLMISIVQLLVAQQQNHYDLELIY